MDEEALLRAAGLTMRQACASDLEALVALRIAAMRDSLERVGRFDETRARERLTRDFSPQRTTCYLHQEAIVAFAVTAREGQELVLKHLYVHPRFQQRGIGALALSRIIAEAAEEGRPIRLLALKESRANRFYLANGFRLVGSDQYDNIYIRPLPPLAAGRVSEESEPPE